MSEAREKYYMKMNNEFIVIDKITAGNYSDEIEQQKAELIELLKNIKDYLQQGKHCNLVSAIYLKDINELLKKNGVEI